MEEIKELIEKKDISTLTEALFGIELTPSQEEIVKIIAYAEHRRVCINAMTRYGKSMCVAIGVALYISFNQDKKVAIIAPQDDQTAIIRNYIAEYISSCPLMAELVDIERDNSIERLKKETSRKRWTFKNGCELRVLSAQGEANRLMGFGADVIICDESALISRDAYAKIVRMLGDDPENSILIELANPWKIDNKYYDHYVSGRFKTIHIGYQTALKEGRITEEFIAEMRSELTPIEFCVLYESNFPAESEDSLLRLAWVDQAVKSNFPLESTAKKIISVDPADKGIDFTVIMWGYEINGKYKIIDIYSEPISDNMNIANKVKSWAESKGADEIKVDCIGVGIGVVSRLKELFKGKNTKITSCHFGEAPEDMNKKLNIPTKSKKRFANKKAEQYFRLRELFEKGNIDIPNHPKLRSELMKMGWEMPTTSEKIRIIDPEDKSPDFADALCYFIWKDKPLVSFRFASY